MASTVPATYKAYTYEAYGSSDEQLKIHEVKAEPLPAQRVRIKVHSAALNPIDYKLVEISGAVVTAGTPTPEKPYRFGFDVAGTIAQVGPGVHPRHLKVGDEVYAMTAFTGCGSVAEYVEIDQQYVALKPKNLDFDHAASVPLVALTSYQALYEYTQLKSDASQRVLILGGSGATDLYAIQFAKLAGAHVTVTGSTKNEPLLKSLGADVVIDYRTQKWVDVIEPHSIDIVYDCGFEPNAWNEGAQTVLKKETGEFLTLLLIGVQDKIESQFGAKNLGGVLCFPNGLHLKMITKLFEEGKLKAIVDSVVPFEKALEGVARVKSRRAVGKVVVKVL